MKSFTGEFASGRGWALLLALLLGAGMMISACGEEETPAPTTPAPPPPAPPPAPEPEPTGPAAPGNLRVTGTTSNSITWTWDAVEGVLGYQGQFSPDATFTETDATFLIVAPATSHTVSNLAGNTTGHFRVRSGTGTALTDLTYSDWSGGVSGTTAAPPPATALDAPDNVRSTDRSDDSITLEWDSVDDADTYEVEQREPDDDWSDANCGADDADNVVDDEECVASGLDSGTDYDFRVRAVPADDDTANLVGAWSDIAETRTDGTSSRPTAPTVSGGMGDLNLRWETTPNGVTWIWDRLAGETYDFHARQIAYSGSTNPCADATWTTNSDSAATSAPLPLTAGQTGLLCVRTHNDDNPRENLSFSWAVATPAPPAPDTDDSATDNTAGTATTSLLWTVARVEGGFNYEMRAVATPGRDTVPTGNAMQRACSEGAIVEQGDTDVLLTTIEVPLSQGLRPYSRYHLCMAYSNAGGRTDWAVSGTAITTLPARPPTPVVNAGRTVLDHATASRVVWTLPVRDRADVPRLEAGYEAFVVSYRERYAYDHDDDGSTPERTAALSIPSREVSAVCDGTMTSLTPRDGVTAALTRAAGTRSTDAQGITVASGDLARPAAPTGPTDPDLDDLRVQLCVRVAEDSTGGFRAGPWVISGVSEVRQVVPSN